MCSLFWWNEQQSLWNVDINFESWHDEPANFLVALKKISVKATKVLLIVITVFFYLVTSNGKELFLKNNIQILKHILWTELRKKSQIFL